VVNKTIVYDYDVGGNILSKTEYPYTIGTLVTATKTINYNYTDANWKDMLTSYDGKEITYDEIGNPLTYDNYTYSWETGNQLAGITGNGVTTSYKYNDGGYRTEKTVNGVTTKYYLEGSHVTYETTGTDEIYYTYDSKLISMNLNGDEYFYVYNLQGDVVGLLDSTGTEVVSYTYDTWGKVLSITGTKASTVGEKNAYRYRGYRYDSETGLYYLNARYYNPEWGRMLNADSFGGFTGELLSHNVYAYVQNNPVMLYDPSGYYAVGIRGEDFGYGGIGFTKESADAYVSVQAAVLSGGIVSEFKALGAGVKALASAGKSKLASGLNKLKGLFGKGTGNLTDLMKKKSLGRGSTGRTTPNNLDEQLAMKEVVSNPLDGATAVPTKNMNDPRWLGSEGWVKMQKIIKTSNGKINIHFNYNTKTGMFDDFKFK
jgi:RHS repeat-associated protein